MLPASDPDMPELKTREPLIADKTTLKAWLKRIGCCRGIHIRHSHFMIASLLILLFLLLFVTTRLPNYAFRDHTQFGGHPYFRNRFESENLLIDTDVCRLKSNPLWDPELTELYESHFNQYYKCTQPKGAALSIRRLNYTMIMVDELKDTELNDWKCFASEVVYQGESKYYIDYHNSRDLGYITDFAEHRWNSVMVDCDNPTTKANYSQVVILIQDFINREVNQSSSSTKKFNVMVFVLDSVSRMNSLRQLRLLNDFYETTGFIELLGYHKVGENTYPNMIPLLTGRMDQEIYNSSFGHNFRWDNVSLIFKDYHRAGYTTAFIEDMAPYGLFTLRGGFEQKPTDYFIREAQEIIWNELTDYYICYNGMVENVMYWQYFQDVLDYLRLKDGGTNPFFSYIHMSTLTHDEFNFVGYADRPYYELFKHMFERKHHENTVIFSLSDHSLRFGSAVDTDANVHESKLPFMHVYIPDSLVLDGRNAKELRNILYGNRKKITSHFDVHATLKHILDGRYSADGKFGVSLLTPIPSDRKCSDAGISVQYCMCSTFEKLHLSENLMSRAAQYALNHLNKNILKGFEDRCTELKLGFVKRIFESIDYETHARRWSVVFTTKPNEGFFEALIDLKSTSDSIEPQFANVINLSRISRFSDEGKCVSKYPKVQSFCYCKNYNPK